jgi:adiponectin receptor
MSTTTTATVPLRTTSESQVRQRRRPSTKVRRQSCGSLSTLDLSAASPALALAAIRTHVLSTLADLEARLALLDNPAEPAFAELRACGEHKLEEARAWAAEGHALLRRVRRECEAIMPALHMEDLSIDAVRAHLPDLPDVRSHLPDIPDVRARLSDMPDLADVHSRLSTHLTNLQTHLTRMRSVEVADLAPSSLLSDLLDRLSASEFASSLTIEPRKDDGPLERKAKELARAAQRSMHGAKLIAYHDLPEAWKNNPFVKSGYRCVNLCLLPE